MSTDTRQHSIFSGAGLVVANMIGVGVLVSTGYMGQDMSAIPILLAWVVGILIAACGLLAYAGIASVISESGGEYRFLSDLIHPFLGYLSGWGSLILGFSAAIAVDAHAIGSFVNTLIDGPDPRITGATIVVTITVLHAFSAKWSHRGQNTLVIVKLLLISGFVCLGLALGSNQMPTWTPPNASDSFPLQKLIENQFWIAFAFSGWNAAVYTAGEFRNPTRDVGRSMMLGFGIVSLFYLLINWIFVANLTPEKAAVVFSYEETRITLAHLIAYEISGSSGGKLISVFVIWVFISAISAMMMIGPRVYVAMAHDGYLPSVLCGKTGKLPLGATLLQAAVTLILLFSHTLREIVLASSAFLMVFSALTAVALFRLARFRPTAPHPATYQRVSAAFFAVAVAYILYTSLQTSSTQWYSLGGVLVLSLVSFVWTRSINRSRQGHRRKP